MELLAGYRVSDFEAILYLRGCVRMREEFGAAH